MRNRIESLAGFFTHRRSVLRAVWVMELIMSSLRLCHIALRSSVVGLILKAGLDLIC